MQLLRDDKDVYINLDDRVQAMNQSLKEEREGNGIQKRLDTIFNFL